MIQYWEGVEKKEAEKELLASMNVKDGVKSRRLSQVVKKLSGIFEEGSRGDSPESGGMEGEGSSNISFMDGVHLENSEGAKVEKIYNAYSADLSNISNYELSTNQKPGNTNQVRQSVSTNERARKCVTRKEGGRSDPVRLPGSN